MRPQVPRPDLGRRIQIRCADGSGPDLDLDFGGSALERHYEIRLLRKSWRPGFGFGGSGGAWKPAAAIFNYRSYRRPTVATLCLPQPLSNEVGIGKKLKRLGLW